MVRGRDAWASLLCRGIRSTNTRSHQPNGGTVSTIGDRSKWSVQIVVTCAIDEQSENVLVEVENEETGRKRDLLIEAGTIASLENLRTIQTRIGRMIWQEMDSKAQMDEIDLAEVKAQMEADKTGE